MKLALREDVQRDQCLRLQSEEIRSSLALSMPYSFPRIRAVGQDSYCITTAATPNEASRPPGCWLSLETPNVRLDTVWVIQWL